ncbi:MAG TPA: glycosyltransferase family 2 protein [Terriglobales bacterium]|nr:glycosyltransferase family 2 protein [Terriglobales bacterium]
MNPDNVKTGPLTSILIPAYNSEKWITATLRSALAQTWEPKEIVVVDDGSTDKTFEIARQFESDSVRVVTQENQGASAARNKAFSLSHGEYIQWLDADDLLAPDKIARQMEALDPRDSGRVLLSSSWGQFLYRPYRARFTPTGLWSDLSPVEWLLCKMGQNVFMQTANWLVSRELSEAAGAWDTMQWVDDDGEYFCRVLLACDSVRFVPEARVYYRVPSVSNLSYIGVADRKVQAQWRSIQLHIRGLRSLEDSERVRAVCVKYLQTSLICFYPERSDIVRDAQQLARDLGGQLEVPRLSWKYSWIEAVFGYRLAKRAYLRLPQIKRALLRAWDKALLRIETRTFPTLSGPGTY